MGAEQKNKSSQVMDLQQLIGAPLIATIEADALSSRRYLDYLFEIAFDNYNRSTGEVGELRNLTFSYKTTEDGKEVMRSVSIPILSLIPLPLLQIKEAEFDFDIKILDACSAQTEENFSFEKGDTVVSEPADPYNKFRLRASLAPTSANVQQSGSMQQTMSANMKVHIKMQQTDIPAGLGNLLQLTASNMQVESKPTE